MTLAEALGRDVSERTRTSNRYFLGGAVRAIEGSATHVLATVRGSELCRCSSRAMAMSSPRPASARGFQTDTISANTSGPSSSPQMRKAI